jgi:hypothetical protein
MNAMKNSLKLVLLVLIVSVFAWGCKSTKKATAARNAAAEKAKMEQEANLRKQNEDKLKREADERLRQDQASAMKMAKEDAPKIKLNEYFNAIANSDNVASANSSINEALTMFASGDTPVLIVISEENGKKDYDRPTTIGAYLNFLKDQKMNLNNIDSLKVDDAGKITEVELRKNN